MHDEKTNTEKSNEEPEQNVRAFKECEDKRLRN